MHGAALARWISCHFGALCGHFSTTKSRPREFPRTPIQNPVINKTKTNASNCLTQVSLLCKNEKTKVNLVFCFAQPNSCLLLPLVQIYRLIFINNIMILVIRQCPLQQLNGKVIWVTHTHMNISLHLDQSLKELFRV